METLHLITGEYPPSDGGVAGYTAEVARALATDGVAVHVWCPGRERVEVEAGVRVHRALGALTREDLRRADADLSDVAPPRRLVVQWVPHAFGRRSLNVSFCRWVARRARVHGDVVQLMVHEPFLDFSWRPRLAVAAAVHRLMARTLLRHAAHVWVSTPAWTTRWRPYAPRTTVFEWLPVTGTVPVDERARRAGEELKRQLTGGTGCLVGVFSLAGQFTERALEAAVLPVLRAHASVVLLLIGRGSIETRAALVTRDPAIAERIHATGPIPAADVSRQLGACDLAVQPCRDGVCTRHSSVTTLMAHGVPIVTTRGRFTEPLWEETGAVALARVDDPGELRRQVEQLVMDPGRRHDLAARARALYDARFDVRHAVRALRTASA